MLAVITLLAGCGAGQQAATATQVANSGGANGDVGLIDVEDVKVTYERPVPGGQVYAAGQSAPLQVTVVNTGDVADRLVSVTSPAAASVEIAGETGMPGGQVLVAGYDDPIESITLEDAEAVEIVLTGLTRPLRAGLTYPVTFTFERAGSLALDVPLENPDVLPPRAGEPDEEGELIETGPEIPAVPE